MSSAVLQFSPLWGRTCFCVVRAQIQRRAAENGQIRDRELLYVQSRPWPRSCFPSHVPPSTCLFPTPCPRPFPFCLSSRTQTWIFNTHKAQGSTGDQDLCLARCRGEEAAGTRYSSQYMLRSGRSAPSTRRVMLSLGHPAAAPGSVTGREGTGQDPVGLRSRLSSPWPHTAYTSPSA